MGALEQLLPLLADAPSWVPLVVIGVFVGLAVWRRWDSSRDSAFDRLLRSYEVIRQQRDDAIRERDEERDRVAQRDQEIARLKTDNRELLKLINHQRKDRP